jgi:hypothetical protein
MMADENQILAEVKEEKGMLEKLNERIVNLADAMQRARIDEYTSMLTRPWRFFFFNFVVGIFRGLGMAVGFTLIFAVVIYLLSRILVPMVDMPIIGMYIGELVKFVEQYLQQGVPTQ